MSLATSTSAKALQRSSADKAVYLYDGSLLVAYWNGSAGQVAQVTSPLTSPSVTNLITTAEDGVSLWTDNSSGTSSDIWVASSFDDASGSGPGLHVRSGTYTSGGGFSWNASTSVPGTTQADTISCTVTWNGTYLLVFLWDGISGSDRLSYAYTADKTGQSGWTNERTLNGGTWSTIVQVAARHSAKLGATVITYGGNSRMFYGALPDGTLGQATGAAASETGTWSGTATTAVAAGIIAAVSPSGTAPVLSCGDVKQVRATAGSVTASWGNGQSRTTGNLLIAAVTATGTTSAAAISTPSGWTQQKTVGGGTAATCALYTKTAAGADAAPAFTSTVSGTATMTVQLVELVNASTSTPLDTSGTNTASGTVASLAVTTAGNIASANDYLLSVFVRERSAGTTTYTPGSGWLNVVNDGSTSSTGHGSLDVKGAGPELNNWAGNGSTGFYSFADNYTNFGGPQLVIDEATGDIHCARAMTTGGGPTNSGICYWHGTYSAGTVTWSSVLVIDADGGAATPADIGAAVDGSSTLYVTYTDAATAGNLKYAKLASPFTSVASGPTVIVAGSGSVNNRWPHSPPVSASMGGLGTALPVLYTNTFATPFPVLLDTSVTLPGGAVSGAASLAGSGTLTAAAAVQLAGGAALTGTGTLAAAAAVTQPAAAALTGSGALAASPSVKLAGAAALSGAGTLTAPRSVQFPGAAALSGSGALAAPPLVSFAASAALSGAGALAVAGSAGLASGSSLSGSGTLTVSGLVTQPGAAALSGSGSVTAAAAVRFAAAAALSGSGALAGQGAVIQPGAASLSGSGALTASGLVTQPGAAGLSGTGSLAPAGTVRFAAAAALSGSGAVVAAGLAVQPGAAALSGSGALTAGPAIQFAPAAALSGSGALTVTAAAAGSHPGTAALSGSGALTVTALVTQPAAAALSGSGAITAAVSVRFTSAAGLSGSGTLTAAAVVTQPGAAALAGSGSLAAAAAVRFTAASVLSGTGTVTAAGAVSGVTAGSAALSGSGTLSASALGQFTAAAALAGSGIVSAAAVVTVPGSGALSGTGLLLSGLSVTVPAAASLSGLGSVMAAGPVSLPAAAALSGSGAVTAGPSVRVAATVFLAGSGTLTVSARVILPVTEPPVLWSARPAALRWQAAPCPPRWGVTPSAPRWRLLMALFPPIAAVSLEEVNVTWESGLAGTTVDPTGQSAGQPVLPVYFAFPPTSGNYAEPAAPVTWYAASWLLGSTSAGYIAQCLVGPGGGVVTLTAGQVYDVWSRVTGNPEAPVKFAGVQAVF